WDIINTLTNDTLYHHDSYPWAQEFTDNYCVFNADCYNFVYVDETQPGIADPGYLEVLYNGIQVGGTTTPGGITGSFIVSNLGTGCLGDDAGVIGITSPLPACGLSNETVTVLIKNFGINAVTNVSVSYTVNGGAPVTETAIGTIASGDTLEYSFTATVNLSVAGTYDISAYTTLPGDGNNSNDTFTGQTTHIAPLAVPVSMGFEAIENLTGWIINNANLDAYTWGIYQGTTYANSGTNFTAYQYNEDGITPADDWLITTCLNLNSGTNYKLDFYYRANAYLGIIYPEKLNVFIGTSQDPASLTTLLVDLDNIADTLYQLSTTPFTVSASGTYYIGFHAYSNANEFILFLDDISIDFSIGTNQITNNNLINIYPNPVKNVLYVTDAENSTINIYNILGKSVANIQSTSATTKINMASFAEGTYIIKVQTGDNVITKKIDVIR
ncbi:MAG: choice-of-anchor J domain-containing protein, partial [Bacteroidia bacterium]|nr:choice-of-anchor J domain-containing protein [Bacteroidia bacterium]